MVDFTPFASPSEEYSRVDLDYIHCPDRFVRVEPEPLRVVFNSNLSCRGYDSVISIHEKQGSFIKSGRPAGGAVRLKAKKGKGEVGSHHLSVTDSPRPSLGPN
jgi:hypothetical protein